MKEVTNNLYHHIAPVRLSLKDTNVTFIGAPGCGKGYLIKKFIQKIALYDEKLLQNIEIISIGQIIRDEIKKDTKLGKQIKNSKKEGMMAPDELINKILIEKLRTCNASLVILDGYPRSVNQLNTFMDIIKNANYDVFYRETDVDTIRERIALRRICENCNQETTISKDTSLNTCFCGGNLIKRREDLMWENRLNEYIGVTKPAIELAYELSTNENNNLNFHEITCQDLNSTKGNEILTRMIEENFIKKYGD